MARDLAPTLAGGGNRAFYQLGVLRNWWPVLEPRVRVIATCSAGACIAAILLSGRDQEANHYWVRRRSGVRRNVDWWSLLRGGRLTPHLPIYRDTMLFALSEGGLERLRGLPFPIYVLAAGLPNGWPRFAAVAVGLSAYSLERWRNPGRLHPGAGRRLGFRPIAVDLRSCPSVAAGADLILASSATPPFTPVGRVNGLAVLDGGVVDNAPAFLADREPGWHRHIVLLTRPYPRASVGVQGRRWYVCPQEPVPVSRWDYTRPERIEQTITLGERDAETRRAELEAFLAYQGPPS